jgi:hypothetical protein
VHELRPDLDDRIAHVTRKECPRWQESLDVTSPPFDDELANWDCFCREAEVRGSFNLSRVVASQPGASFVNGAA